MIGHHDEIRGDCPVAFVILRGNHDHFTKEEKDRFFKEINDKVRNDVGPIAKLEGIIFAQKLPKTRSGKILRGTIKKICNRDEYKTPATIDDASVLDDITALSKEWYEGLKK